MCGRRDSFTFAPAPPGCTTSISLDTSACPRPLVFSAPPSGHHRRLQQATTGPLWTVNNGTQLSLSNTEFSGYTGRTIFLITGTNSKYTLNNVTISNNVGGSLRAPIEVTSLGQLQLTSCRFINNIYVQANCVFGLSANQLDIQSCTFTNNNRRDGSVGGEQKLISLTSSNAIWKSACMFHNA